MVKRIGAVLIFKHGVSMAQVKKALDGIGDLLVGTKFVSGHGYRAEEYDDEWGDPVWYIP